MMARALHFRPATHRTSISPFPPVFLGEPVRKLRESKDMSQETLADAAGLHRPISA